jgi:very-short-patch-repair endonuclease
VDENRYLFFLALLAMRKLPEPVQEFKFHPSRKWRMDFAWPDQRIALEVEGGIWSGGRHTRGKGYLADMEKYNEATLMGFKLLRVTPQQMDNGDAVELVERLFTKP